MLAVLAVLILFDECVSVPAFAHTANSVNDRALPRLAPQGAQRRAAPRPASVASVVNSAVGFAIATRAIFFPSRAQTGADSRAARLPGLALGAWRRA